MRKSKTKMHRLGAAMVETAMVLPVFILFLFGIIEFSIFLMMQHTANVAATLSCRLATVSTNDPSVVGKTQAVADKVITDKFKNTMAGAINLISNGNPTITVQGLNSSNAKIDWRKTSFSDKIAVEVKSDYFFLTPMKMLFTKAPVNVKVFMASEGS